MQTAHKLSQHSAPESRRRMIAAIHITWTKLRPDLRHDKDELRDERLAFITDVLKLKRPPASMRDLTSRQLGIVLDAMKSKAAQPALPNYSFCKATGAPERDADNKGAEIIHLASAEQVHVIHKLLDYLNWSIEAREHFIKKRFKRSGPALLTPKQAHSLVMILLYIAAARSIKERGHVGRVTRPQIRQEIPELKERLGIDRKDD